MLRILLLVFALTTPSGAHRGLAHDEKTVVDLVAKLKSRADSAEIEWIDRLADERSSAGLAGLIQVFDAMQSIYMRRAVLRGLAVYDELPELSRRSLDKLRDIATTEEVRQVRKLAVDTIAGCRNNGRHYLRSIVDSPAATEVREWAMQHLAGAANPADFNWYLGHFRLPGGTKLKKARESQESALKTPPSLRELAFGVVAPGLEADELLRALSDPNRDIRAAALGEIESRDDDQVGRIASRFYGNASERPGDRLVAARLLARHKVTEFAPRFAKDGTRKDTPYELALGLGQLLAEVEDPKIQKLLLKGVGKGKGQALLFSYWATERIASDRVDKALKRGLKNKDPRIVVEAARILGERGNVGALPALEKQLAKGPEPSVFVPLSTAIGALRQGDPEWIARLEAMVGSESRDVRIGAIQALQALKKSEHLALFTMALSNPDWSTRLAAARALFALGTHACIALLCTQIEAETGRVAAEMGRMLFELTGKPYGDNGRVWAAWWKEQGADFKPISSADLRKARREEERRHLRRTTISSFVGIEIESHNVLFVVDISGSMDYLTEAPTKAGKGVPRIDFAKNELLKCLDGIDRNSFFNILAFSDRVFPWSEEMRSLDGSTLELAKDYVRGLRIGGGTNLYGALRQAFDDPEVDTMFLVSDGEPSTGDVVDPGSIRDIVAHWNAQRGVRIHSIAIGEDLRILRWLAEDSGGYYIEIR